MADDIRHSRVESVDWLNLLPALRLFRTFHMAVHPAKLFLALVLVVLVYLSGLLLDQVWGRDIYPGEVEAYQTMEAPAFESWRRDRLQSGEGTIGWHLRQLSETGYVEPATVENFDRTGPDRFARLRELTDEVFAKVSEDARSRQADMPPEQWEAYMATMHQQQQAMLEQLQRVQPRGRFATALNYELDAFQRLMRAAMSMHIGGAGLASGVDDQQSVIGALHDMVIVLPRWLLVVHPWFTLGYGLILLLLWAVFGGALTRMAAVQATRNQTPPMVEAVRFAIRRFWSLLMAPLMPVIVVFVLAAVLVVAGFLAFGIPYVNQVLGVLGGLLFIIAIVIGLAIALVKIALVLAFGLYYPAIAVEDSDAFDANSRANGYVIYRVWHLLFYNFVALVYMAVTYIFVGGVIFLALLGAHYCVSMGANALGSGTPFEQIMPAPKLGQLTYQPHRATLTAPESITAVLVMVWVYLFVGLSAAYALSYYFTANTWIYLLLRRSADGTDFSELYTEPTDALEAAAPSADKTPDKVEPQDEVG